MLISGAPISGRPISAPPAVAAALPPLSWASGFTTPHAAWAAKRRRNVVYAADFVATGITPGAEPVTADRFCYEVRLPRWTRRRLPPLVEYTPDPARLGDVEAVLVTSWHVPMGRVVVRRRGPPWHPGSEQTLRDVWPDPPESNTMPPWHVALSTPPPRLKSRAPRNFFPDGGMVFLSELAVEDPQIKFHVPLAIPQLRRRPLPPERPLGGIDLVPEQRIEVLFTDAFLVWMPLLPARNRRRVDASRATQGLPTPLTVEAVHAEVLGRDVIVRPHPFLPLHLAQMADGSVLAESNFISPFIAKMKKAMLAGGFWRARL